MKMPENPCHDCTDRTSYCHSDCERHDTWHEEWLEYKDFIYKQRKADRQANNYEIDKHMCLKKGYNRK